MIGTDIAVLLAETRWLTRLARGVAGDAATADDLAQETLAQALERPPATDRPLRGWLATVLHHRARDASRAQVARRSRECRSARAEPQAATIDVVARAELQRRLVGAVLALDEPHRTCVLLRFFDGLPPRAIARQTATPVATVHSRLQRALELLRTRLGPARHEWLAAVAPLLPPRLPAGTLILGVPLVNTLGKVALGAAVVVSCAYWLWQQQAPPASIGPARDQGAVAAAEAGIAGEREAGAAAANERTQLEPPPPAAAATPADEPAAALLRGRVIDVSGRGLAGVRLRCEGDGAADAIVAPSGADGRFGFATPAGARAVVADDARWSTVLAGAARTMPGHECTVIVASRLHLSGHVVDGGGQALAGAEVTVQMPAHLGADLGILLDYSLRRTWRTVTGDDGAFALPDVPFVERGTVTASLGGYDPANAPLVANPAPLRLVLERPAAADGLVRGVVLDSGGAAVAGAHVSAGAEIARTDARGAFLVDVAQAGPSPRLVAVARGFQPALYEPARGADGAPRWPAQIVLRLGGPPLAIAGRVADRAGRPVTGARVWIADPLYVGHDGADVVLAETLLGRADRPFWAFVPTDADGCFRIEGLLDRPYALRALDPRTLVLSSRDGVRAGDQAVELQLDSATHPRVRGRVLARDGSPLPGVSVKAQRPALEVQVPGGTRDEWADGVPVTTDAQGRFELADVPQDGVEIFAWGDTIQFAGRILTPDADAADFVITADRRVHLQVELLPPVDRADTLRVLDADGKPMLLRIMRGDMSFTNRKAAIEDGRSQVISLGEGAAAVAFFRGDREVGRVAVQLAAGRINTVTF